jgi:electron transfer flavoprotein alpha subunit
VETILIFVEIKGNEARKVSLELLSEARKLAQTGRFATEAVVIGQMPAPAKETILPYVNRLTHITDPALAAYTPEGYSAALADHARAADAQIILAGATQTGRDFLPRVAVLLGCGIASDVTAADWSENPISFVRPMYGGKVMARISFPGYPFIVTTRPNAFEVTEPGATAGEFAERQANLPAGKVRAKVVRFQEKSKDKVDLTEAESIVAGGRGLKGAENFTLLEELADAIGATVGATRSVVDAKWRDQEDQVGKSGKTVSPKLYIAAGISGAIHHIMGMDTSKVVLAINKDPNAIIFNYANYGIVGDLFDVVPAMTNEVKKRSGK